MRVLRDECLPRKLKYRIVGHDVSTVQERGWSSKKNGDHAQFLTDGTDRHVSVVLSDDPCRSCVRRITLVAITDSVGKPSIQNAHARMPRIDYSIGSIGHFVRRLA